MEAALVLLLVIAASSFTDVQALSSGAPAEACVNLTPDPVRHNGEPQTSPVPYNIDLTPLGAGYTPGQTYTLSLSGNTEELFRGFLVQSRTSADDSMVGTFAEQSPDVQLSRCTPNNIGVTHNSGADKDSVSFQWTAPPEGTGPIRFRFAVVESRMIFWADQSSPIVQELVQATTVGMQPSTEPAIPLLEDLEVDVFPANGSVSRGLPRSLYCQITDRTGAVSQIPTQWYINGRLYNESIGIQAQVFPEGFQTNITILRTFEFSLSVSCQSTFYPGVDLASFTIQIPDVTIRFDQLTVNASEGNNASLCVSAFFANEFFLEGFILVNISVIQGSADISDFSGTFPRLGFRFGIERNCFHVFINNDTVTEGEESFALQIALDPIDATGADVYFPPELTTAVVNIRETCYDGEVRLRGGYDEFQGRVEVCYGGVWGTVCSDTGWVEGGNADVVCRQLGLQSFGGSGPPMARGFTGAIFGPGSYAIPIHLDNVLCSGSEMDLFNCSHSPIGQHSCMHTEDASVDCLGRDPVGAPCSMPGDVQLVGGIDEFQGRVEVCTMDNVYSTVCDIGWDNNDARVVCTQLGFESGSAVAARGAVFGKGVGTIQISNVNCVGNEDILINCSIIGQGPCTHFQDAGVDCLGRPPPATPMISFDGHSFFIREGQSTEICVELVSGSIAFEFVVRADIIYPPSVMNRTQEISINSPLTSSVEAGSIDLFLGPSKSRSCFTITAVNDDVPEEIEKMLSIHLVSSEVSPYTVGNIMYTTVVVQDDDFLCEGGGRRCLEERDAFCVEASLVCDGLPVCSDGSDETNCPDYCAESGMVGGYNCLPERKCLPQSYVCDSIPDCVNVRSFEAVDELGECAADCTHGSVNLLGGASDSEGTVEVCLNGIYYAVSLQNGRFSVIEASVICRQLGQGSAGIPLPANDGNSIRALQVATVTCQGSEDNVAGCTLGTIPFNDRDSATAFVRCFQQEEPVTCQDGDIRLSGGPNSREGREGRVEICYQNIWGVVQSRWSEYDAAVACTQLGFNRYGALPITEVYFGSTNFAPVSLASVNCVGTESSLLDCPTQGDSVPGRLVLGQTGFYQNERDTPVGVRCEDYPTTGCSPFDARLIYRSAESTGILEVCNQLGEWSIVCADGSVLPDGAMVACTQLGYMDAVRPYINIVTFNPNLNDGSREITDLLSETGLFCFGNESHLSECRLPPQEPGPTQPGIEPMSCSRVARIGCNTSPQVTFNPASSTGSYQLEVEREFSFSCSYDDNVFPSPTTFASSRLSQRNKRGIPPPISQNPINVLANVEVSPLTEDVYFCGGIYAGQRSFEENVTVSVREPSGLNQSAYIRISAVSFDRLSSRSISAQDIDRLILNLIPEVVPGVHIVRCKSVNRTEFDIMRDLDRIECEVTQSSDAGEVVDVGDVARRAAAITQRVITIFQSPIDVSDTGFCDQEMVDAITGTTFVWPETIGGEMATFVCPFSPTTEVLRSCMVGGVWNNFDEAGCGVILGELNALNDSFTNLTVDTYADAVTMLSEALSMTEDADIEQNEAILGAVADYFNELATFVTDTNVTINATVVTDVVQSVSSLLQWNPENVERVSSSSVLESFDTVISMYAQQLPLNQVQNFTMPSLTVNAELRSVVDLALTGRSFTIGDNVPGDFAPEGGVVADALLPQQDAGINLPATLFSRIANRTNVGVYFALYNRTVLFPTSEMRRNISGEETVPAVGSRVFAATVGPGLNFTNLEEPVTIVLRLISQEGTFIPDSERCVSWDFASDSWTSEGCVRTTTSQTAQSGVITCECNHLTNFAVLVDICLRQDGNCGRSAIDEALTFISYIGLTVSIVALVITIITLLLFKKLRQKDATKYHVQLSLAILLMLIVAFVVVVISAEDLVALYGGCVTMSVLVHYFTLVAAFLMGAEALLMFQKLVLVFSRVTTKLIVSVSIVCWTVPIIPVAIPLIVDLADGTDISTDIVIKRAAYEGDIAFCFLSNQGAFWGAFLAIIFAVLIFNAIVFIWVIVVLVRHTRNTARRKKEAVSNKTIIRLMISISGVMSLFGLTWLFAILTVSVTGLREAFQILFTIFNGFQGFFIFLFFCVFNKEAIESWKEFLSCGKYKSTLLHPSQAKYSSGVGTATRNAKKNKTASTGFGTSSGGKHAYYASETSKSKYEPSPLSKHKEFESEADRDVETTPLKSKENLSSPELDKKKVSIEVADQQSGEAMADGEQKKKKTLSLKARIKRYSTKKVSKHHVEEVEVDFRSEGGSSDSSSEGEAVDAV